MILLFVIDNAVYIHESQYRDVACETNILHYDGLVHMTPCIELAHLAMGGFVEEHQLHL